MLSRKHITVCLHDARLSRITVERGGNVELVFRHVDVYVHAEGPRFEVWAHAAVLEMHDVSAMRLTGPNLEEGWVMDGSIPGDMGRGAIELPGKSEVVRFGKGTTWFAFADGGRLELEAAEASFRLTDSGRHLEDFHEDGPSRER